MTDNQLSIRLNDREIKISTYSMDQSQTAFPLKHGYASTIYGAQGLTSDAAFVLVGAKMNRHDIYVASSRAREKCNLYIDERAVKAELRQRAELSKRNDIPYTKQEQRNYLAKCWAGAARKTSTLDYIAQSNTDIVHKSVTFKMPAVSRDF